VIIARFNAASCLPVCCDLPLLLPFSSGLS
jgi:hypothetical protein